MQYLILPEPRQPGKPLTNHNICPFQAQQKERERAAAKLFQFLLTVTASPRLQAQMNKMVKWGPAICQRMKSWSGWNEVKRKRKTAGGRQRCAVSDMTHPRRRSWINTEPPRFIQISVMLFHICARYAHAGNDFFPPTAMAIRNTVYRSFQTKSALEKLKHWR